MSKLILIAEDSPTTAAYIRAILEPLGCGIVIANDGEQAEREIKQCRPDLLILDIILPKVNGFELCRTLRGDPELKTLPIIVVSAMDRESDRFWGLKQGADEFLVKPVDPELLVEKVRSYL